MSDFEEDNKPREREQKEIPTSPPFVAYVGNLSFEITDNDVQEFFNSAGCDVAGVRLVRSKEDRSRLKGFGYVEFTDQKSLKIALAQHDSELLGRAIRVDIATGQKPNNYGGQRGGRREWNQRGSGGDYDNSSGGRQKYGRSSDERPEKPERPEWADQPREQKELPTQPPYVAYIGNLSFDLDEAEVLRFFKQHHCEVDTVKLLRSREDPSRLKGFGYVDFVDVQSLENALKLHGVDLLGRPLRVDIASNQKQTPQISGTQSGFNNYNAAPSRSDVDTWRRDDRESVSQREKDGSGFRKDNYRDNRNSRGDRGGRGAANRGGSSSSSRNESRSSSSGASSSSSRGSPNQKSWS